MRLLPSLSLTNCATTFHEESSHPLLERTAKQFIYYVLTTGYNKQHSLLEYIQLYLKQKLK